MFYAVVKVENSEVVWIGGTLGPRTDADRSAERQAAIHLKPGTVWGQGGSKATAKLRAERFARKARANKVMEDERGQEKQA